MPYHLIDHSLGLINLHRRQKTHSLVVQGLHPVQIHLIVLIQLQLYPLLD